jgi:hypothetical protein
MRVWKAPTAINAPQNAPQTYKAFDKPRFHVGRCWFLKVFSAMSAGWRLIPHISALQGTSYRQFHQIKRPRISPQSY